MFSFLRKKKKIINCPITKIEIDFFRNLILILPHKYHYLLQQINEEFLISYSENQLGFKNSYTFSLNARLEYLYINKKLPDFFILQNVKIWNTISHDFISINLNILSGYLGGFNIETLDFTKFDFTKFDISEIQEKHFENKELKKLLSKLNLSKSEQDTFEEKVNDTYSIELPEGVFYYIDDVGNGDVVAIDISGNCYLLIHDPGKIIQIFNKEEFLSKLKMDSLLKDATDEYDKYFS